MNLATVVVQPPEAVFIEKRGVWDNMLEMTKTPPYLIVNFKVQLSTPATTYAYNCFPNYSKMEQPIGKGRVGRVGKG